MLSTGGPRCVLLCFALRVFPPRKGSDPFGVKHLLCSTMQAVFSFVEVSAAFQLDDPPLSFARGPFGHQPSSICAVVSIGPFIWVARDGHETPRGCRQPM